MGETYPGHLAGVVDAESLNEAPQERTRDEGADVIRASIDGAVGGRSGSVIATLADHLTRVVDAESPVERTAEGAQVVDSVFGLGRGERCSARYHETDEYEPLQVTSRLVRMSLHDGLLGTGTA